MDEKTNVMRILDQKKIKHQTHSYVGTGAISGTEVAEALGQDPKCVFKTLVTIGKSKSNYVFVIPVEKELDLKKAAKTVGEKSIEMIKSNPLTEDVDKLFVFSIDEEEIINYICFELSTIETCANEDNTSGLIYYIKKNNLLDKEHFIYKDKSLKTKHSHMHCEIIENKDGFPIKIGGKASIYLEGVVTYG